MSSVTASVTANATIIVLFNLKSGVDPRAYEQWARTTDLPMVRKLRSVDSFEILRSQGLLGSDAPAPYQYVEILRLKSLEQLGTDIAAAAMQRVVKEFGEFADQPFFIIGRSL